jgi:hypothetical protein
MKYLNIYKTPFLHGSSMHNTWLWENGIIKKYFRNTKYHSTKYVQKEPRLFPLNTDSAV